MNFDFHPEAEEEFHQSINYYENCEEGLGYQFAIEVYSAIQLIIKFPQAWQIMDKEVRRCQTHRFPYGILYSIEPDRVFILAIMYLHRKPGYWKNRLKY